jgi:hypothetical protein
MNGDIYKWVLKEKKAAVAASGQLVREICTWVQERCTKQLALTANRKLKYPSSHPVTDLYTAGIATRTIDQKDTK